MRMMLRFKVPVEKGNQAFEDGSMAATIQGVMQSLKPEAAYFFPDEERSGFMIFDMEDPSQIPVIAEPLFSNLHAKIDVRPVMNIEDLQKGLSGG